MTGRSQKMMEIERGSLGLEISLGDYTILQKGIVVKQLFLEGEGPSWL